MQTHKLLTLIVLSYVYLLSCNPSSQESQPVISPDTTLLKSIQNTVDSANHYVYLDINKADSLLQKVFDTPHLKEILPADYYKPYMVKAWVHHGRKQYEDAKEFYLKAANIVAQSNDRTGYIECWINLGALLEQSKDTSALAYVEEFLIKLDTTQSEDDKIGWILGHQYKARIFRHQHKYELALTTLVEALEIPFLPEFPNYSLGIFKTIGILQKEIGNPQSAEKYLQKALSIQRLFPYEKKMLLGELTQLHIEQDSLEKANTILETYANLGNLSEVECQQYHWLYAHLQLKKNFYQKALTSSEEAKRCAAPMQAHEIQLSNLLLETAIRLKLKQDLPVQQLIADIKQLLAAKPKLNTLKVQSNLASLKLHYQLLQQAPTVLPVVENYQNLTQQQYAVQSAKKLKEVTVSYEATKKEQENQLLKQDIEVTQLQLVKSRLVAWIFGIGFLLTLLAAYQFFVNNRLKQRINLLLQQKNSQLSSKNEQLETEKQEISIEKGKLLSEKERLKAALAAAPLEDNLIIHGELKDSVVPFGSIKYIKAQHEGSRFYLDTGEELWSATPLKKVIPQLPEHYFTQTFRGIIVNERFIKSVNSKMLTLQCGATLPVSRNYKKNLDKFKQKAAQ